MTKRTRLIAVVAAVLTLASAFAGWRLLAARAAGEVSVSWRLDCPDTKLVRYQGEMAIPSRPGWRCTVELMVSNHSGRDIHVHDVEGPFMGSGGGAEIQGFSGPQAPISDAGSPSLPNDVDARWRVDLTVRAHSEGRLDLPIGWRRSGCNDAGSFWLTDWPTVDFTVLRSEHRASPDQRLRLRTYDDPHDKIVC